MTDKPVITKRDVAAKWWRQVGFWGLTIMMILGFPLIAFVVIAYPEGDSSAMVTAYGTTLAAWTACAGIRQWGKIQDSEPTATGNYEGL